MIVNIDTHRVKTLDDVRVFLASSSAFQFTLADREAAYPWIEATLTQLGYKKLGKGGERADQNLCGESHWHLKSPGDPIDCSVPKDRPDPRSPRPTGEALPAPVHTGGYRFVGQGG